MKCIKLFRLWSSIQLGTENSPRLLWFCFPYSVIGLEMWRHHEMQNSNQTQLKAPSKAKLSKVKLLVLERQKIFINEYGSCNPYFSSSKFNLHFFTELFKTSRRENGHVKCTSWNLFYGI